MKREELFAALFEDMACIGRQIIPFSLAKSNKKGPTKTQLGILFSIQYTGPQNVKELAYRFGMTPSAITQIADSLVKEKLVIRKEDTNDRRKICISLTSKGKKKLEQIKEARLKSFTTVFAPLTTSELTELKNLYSKVITKFK